DAFGLRKRTNDAQNDPRAASTRSGPAPIGSETGAVPTDHRLRLEDFQRIEHLRGQTIEPGKHQAINVAESHSLGRSAMQHIELVSKEQDFSVQRSPRPE